MGTILQAVGSARAIGVFVAAIAWAASTPVLLAATTWHVDGDRGNNANSGRRAASAWRDPWVAAGRVAKGDTVIIHPRQNDRPYHHPKGQAVLSFPARAAGTTWRAAPGKLVRLSSTPDFKTPPYLFAGKRGSTTVYIDVPNIVLDGFHIWGSVFVNKDGDDATIQNCDLSGGNDYQGFPAVIRTSGDPPGSTPSNWCEGLTVRHCRIHDNVPAASQGGNNNMLVLTYGAKDMVVEHCEFFNGLSAGIRWKDRANGMTARFNYFHDIAIGIHGSGQYAIGGIDTHDNLFVGCTRYAVAVGQAAATDFRVYNNTFYNNAVDIGWWHAGGGNLHIFNNVFAHQGGQRYLSYDEQWHTGIYKYYDYNLYFSGDRSTRWRGDRRATATRLADWQALVKPWEQHSREAHPGFTGGNTPRTPDDFRRTSPAQDGRGGTWPNSRGIRFDQWKPVGVNAK